MKSQKNDLLSNCEQLDHKLDKRKRRESTYTVGLNLDEITSGWRKRMGQTELGIHELHMKVLCGISVFIDYV